jgi:hypothetical protein
MKLFGNEVRVEKLEIGEKPPVDIVLKTNEVL